MSFAWISLFFAGIFEICWVIGLKYTNGFTKLMPSIFTIISLMASMYLLAKAVEHLPIGTAYGVWVGIGTVGAVILGIILFKEPANLLRVFFILLLIISIVGLKMTSSK